MEQDNSLKVSLPKTILYSLIILGNLVTIGSPLNLLVSIPEIVFVFFLLFRNRVDLAIFYHLIFIVTSISATNVMGMADNPVSMFSYSRLKVVGPVGASYLISIFLLLFSLAKKSKIPEDFLYFRLFRGFLMLGTCGFFIGCIGLLFDSHYSIDGMLVYGIYIFIVIISMYSILLNYSDSFVKLFFDNVVPLLSASVYASFIAYAFIGISTSYGGLDNVVLKADLVYYAPILLLSLLYVKNKIQVIIPCILLIVLSFNSSGGKEIIILGTAFLFFVFGLLKRSGKVGSKSFFISRVAVIASVLIVAYVFFNSAQDSLFSMKLGAVISLTSTDMSDINESPYIRIGEILNVWQGYINRPYLIPFGSGYGGYFVDHLNMFAGINLEAGSYSSADVASGFYHDAHDTFSIVPFLNGLLGLWIIFSYSFKYIKRIKNNFCAFAVIPWLFFTFYFNVQGAVSGIFLLFSAEYLLTANSETIKYNSKFNI